MSDERAFQTAQDAVEDAQAVRARYRIHVRLVAAGWVFAVLLILAGALVGGLGAYWALPTGGVAWAMILPGIFGVFGMIAATCVVMDEVGPQHPDDALRVAERTLRDVTLGLSS